MAGGRDLVVDRVYKGGTAGNAADDPLARLLPGWATRAGSARWAGRQGRGQAGRAVHLRRRTGLARRPGPLHRDLHLLRRQPLTRPGTARHPAKRGNLLLSRVFERAHAGPGGPAEGPAVPAVRQARHGPRRAVPRAARTGSDRLSGEEDLVAVWRTTEGQRFQNYRARFTVLDAASVTRAWIGQIIAGDPLGTACPAAGGHGWKQAATGRCWHRRPSSSAAGSSKQPAAADKPLLHLVYEHFKDRPSRLRAVRRRHVAGQPAQRRPDRRHPALARRRPGRRRRLPPRPAADPVAVEFALEAKCYAPGNGVGVRETSRLISRLRHRQFGVLVTTSHLDAQAYQEIREDGHPVVILAGRDIADILKSQGLTLPASFSIT